MFAAILAMALGLSVPAPGTSDVLHPGCAAAAAPSGSWQHESLVVMHRIEQLGLHAFSASACKQAVCMAKGGHAHPPPSPSAGQAAAATLDHAQRNPLAHLLTNAVNRRSQVSTSPGVRCLREGVRVPQDLGASRCSQLILPCDPLNNNLQGTPRPAAQPSLLCHLLATASGPHRRRQSPHLYR